MSTVSRNASGDLHTSEKPLVISVFFVGLTWHSSWEQNAMPVQPVIVTLSHPSDMAALGFATATKCLFDLWKLHLKKLTNGLFASKTLGNELGVWGQN